MERTIKQLAQALHTHDWFFPYSDDAGIRRRGYAQWEEIRKLCGSLGRDEAKKVWDEACTARVIPHECRGAFPLK